MQQNQLKSISVAFTGHRYMPYSDYPHIAETLKSIITDLYKHGGIRNFYCGMAVGFDMFAAEKVLELKKQMPDITLSAVIPYRNQSERFSPKAKVMYQRLLGAADEVMILNEEYYDRCFLDRNDYMIERSMLLIAYYDRVSRGGTSYTVNKATSRYLSVINLYRP